MTFICFVESDALSVPHMEPLTAETVEDAREEARRLLSSHVSGVAAHVFSGDERVISIEARQAAG